MVIKLRLSDKGVKDAINQVKEARKKLKWAQDELVVRLSDFGASRASLYFDSAQMSPGDEKPVISVKLDRGAKRATITASSRDVGFIEFGAGSRFASSPHPLNSEFGTGPGTWSEGPNGKGRWNDPRGWFYNRDGTKMRSYGQPAAKAMYQTSLDIQEEVERIVREVLGG